MTPRDALKHVYAPFKKPAQPQGYPEQPAVFEAERKLSALKAEIEVGTFEGRSVAKDEGRGRVDPAQALHWFVLSDVAALIVGLVLSWAVAVIANDFLLGRGFDFSPVEAYRLAQFTVIGAGVITWLASKGHYRLRRPFWSEVEQVATACAFAVILDGFFQFAAKVDFSRLWLVVAWVFAGVLMIVFRSLTRRALDRRGLWSVNTLLVGSGQPQMNAVRPCVLSPCLAIKLWCKLKIFRCFWSRSIILGIICVSGSMRITLSSLWMARSWGSRRGPSLFIACRYPVLCFPAYVAPACHGGENPLLLQL